MFNFIMSTGIRDRSRGSILKSRVFERTNATVESRFKNGLVIDFEKLSRYPAVFLEEGVDSEPVGLGYFKNVRSNGALFEFDIILDSNFPVISNAEFLEICEGWGFNEYNFSRNFWQIVEEDLFKGLYASAVKLPPSPKAFELSDKPVDDRLVSFMMPFSPTFNSVYSDLRIALEGRGFRVSRADDIWQNDHIMQDIIELICTAKIVVCDLSTKNPNVFYEAGIAHTIGKNVILLAQSIDDVPFDLRALRCLTYLNNEQGRAELAEKLLDRVEQLAAR